MNKLISIKDVSVTLGRHKALDNINWQVHKGESWAILGGNGAGKSTLLRLVVGELWPDQKLTKKHKVSGLKEKEQTNSAFAVSAALTSHRSPASSSGESNLSGGQHFTAASDSGEAGIAWFVAGKKEVSPLAIKNIVAVVSPELQTWYVEHGWDLSGEELLLTGLYASPLLYSPPRTEEVAEIQALAKELELEHLLTKSVAAMSQGQLRSMLVARALAAKPAILALDEVFEGLDEYSTNILQDLLAHLNKEETALFISAHRKEDLPSNISHALVLDNGCIAYKGPIAESQIQAVCLFDPPSNTITANLSAFEAPPVDFARPPFLELENVNIFVERSHVLYNINWTVEKGQNWAVLGENGSGKTTLLRCLWGDEHPALGGKLAWFGNEGPFDLPTLHKNLGLVSDRLQASIPKDMLAKDIVVSGFFSSIDLYEEPTPQQRNRAQDIMQATNLAYLEERRADTLSYGQLRRLLLCRALVHSPRLLLLDEPCSGLDNESRTSFLDDLATSVRGGTTQVIHITHRTDDLAGVTTHALHLSKGHVVYCGVYPRRI